MGLYRWKSTIPTGKVSPSTAWNISYASKYKNEHKKTDGGREQQANVYRLQYHSSDDKKKKSRILRLTSELKKRTLNYQYDKINIII